MENAGYTTLTRQSGLLSEMRIVANNIANASTTGFRQEGIVFSEYIRELGSDDASLSMASAQARNTSLLQGGLSQTGSAFDLAIEGAGFFQIETPEGPRLTRDGHFTPNEVGDLVTDTGQRVLDAGGAPVFVPPGLGAIGISADGTVSAGGRPIGQIGLVLPAEGADLIREEGTRFRVEGEVAPAEEGRILQGFLEGSNVNPLLQVSRMIEVQRAYELGQSFLDKEDERIRSILRVLGQ
ncbi:flagellar hook-basal body complex protein [Aestuariibius insulae]|uniref:flagellar hook-basal body complex protein n=1 Tax=Aestuariibius insulae TaxID=2058287 RepID=UPI00345E92D0